MHMCVPHINLISKFPWKPPAAHQGAVEFWRSVRECSSRWIHRAKDADGKNMRRTYQGKPQSEIAANSCKFFILWAEWVRKNPLTLIHVDLDIYIYHFFGGDHSPHEQSRQAATRFPFRLGETCWNTANCKIHENTPSKQQSTGVTHWRVFFLRHLQPWPPSYEFAQDTRDGGRWNRHSQDWTSPRVSRQDMTWHVVELDGYN